MPSPRWVALLLTTVAILYAYGSIHFVHHTYLITAGVIALCLGVLLAFTRYTMAFALLLLTLPLSIEVPLGSADNKLLVPSEGLMAMLGIAFATGLLLRRSPERQLLRHPLSVLILLYLGVMILTAIVSAAPLVSFKYTVVNGAYMAIFYWMAYDFLRRKPNRILAFFFLYGMPMLLVVGYALSNHSTVNFHHDASGIVVRPFFSDHTLYSACLAMLLPMFVAFGWKGECLGLKRGVRRFSMFVALLMTEAIFFSFSRATWLGLGVALLFYGVLRWQVRPAYLAYSLLLGLVVAGFFRNELLQSLKMNRHSSTDKDVDLTEQTMSVTNISSDVSNAERLNRWSCAWRMFLDRPLTGFGPGTYQFEYLPYQRREEMTRISVTSAYNNVFGRGGSAHSEYLIALAESGIAGFLLFAAIVICAIRTGMRAYASTSDERTRLLLAAVCVSLISFCTHVLFNNFLNNNKAAALFWGLLAVIVLLDNQVQETNKR